MSLNHELSDIFARMAAIMEIKGEVAFKAIAFSKVSRVLKDMTFDIRQAAEEGRLDQIEGIGKSSQKIIEEYVKTGRSTDCDERLRKLKEVKQAEIAGSLRRRRETIGDVDLICSVKEMSSGQTVSTAFTQFPEVQRILGEGSTKASVITAGGLQVDLRIVPTENF